MLGRTTAATAVIEHTAETNLHNKYTRLLFTFGEHYLQFKQRARRELRLSTEHDGRTCSVEVDVWVN